MPQNELIARDSILKQRGYASYRHYLRSDEWNSVRQRAFSILGRKCCCCPKKATQIHHSQYTEANLVPKPSAEEIERTMHPICRKCHEKIHFKKGQFRLMPRSRHSLKQKVRNREKATGKKRSIPKGQARLKRQMELQRIENERLLAESYR